VIDVYTWTTGNSRKIPIFLEEAQVPYRLHMVNIRTGEQFKPEFVAICPTRMGQAENHSRSSSRARF
jgi:GSH-dependent disulfide-bond oxidoreductase